MDSSIPRCILLIVLIVVGGFFSGAETAFSYCNKIRMKTLADNGKRSAARVVKITEDFDRMLVTVLIMINVLHVAASTAATLLAVSLLPNNTELATLLATIVLTILVFFVSENIPKSFAKENCDNYALFSSSVIYFLMLVLTPFSFLFTKLGDLLKKLFRSGEHEPRITEDEFSDIVEQIQDEGVLEPEESRIIRSAVGFSDVKVKDILTPVEEVACIEKGLEPDEIVALVREKKFSRMPVYDHDLSHIVGILQTKEYLTAYLNQQEGDEPLELKNFLQPAYFVKPDMNLDALFESMGRRKSHFAVVAKNETMQGVVTMEDLLENLVGEIYDEDESAPPETEEATADA